MIISFFSTGTGGGAAPVDYLIAREVLAYDENRNLIRDDIGQPQTKIRDPLPEVLHGNPDQTRDLIDASANKWSYTAGVISFAESDDPSTGAQQEAIELFEALAFAGLDRDQYDCLWVRHSHEGNVELHFCTPRLELSTGKALNIAPPGHENAFASLRDLMNKTHGWADPLDPARAREVRATIEAPTRAQGREGLHDWILDQISVGTITDRASMIDALTDAGFEIPRTSKNYITAKDPDTGERWRLKGEIIHDNWQAEPPRREIERGPGDDPERPRRLDGISSGQLQERFQQHCDQRAAYNRDRYQVLSQRQQERVGEAERDDQALADDLAVGDRGDGLGLDRDGADRELVLDGFDDALGVEGTGSNPDRTVRADMGDAGPEPDRTEDLHDGTNIHHLYRDQGALDDQSTYNTPDSFGARIARIRRTVGDGLRELRQGIARLGETLDQQDRKQGEWLGALRGAIDEVTSHVRHHIGRLAARGAELRHAAVGVRDQLEASEGRREAAERKLDARDSHRSAGHSL
ncbi:relaxase/mobilization nuclease domain-containing protein [Sulfitobacter aestuariivivens]|uniref:Relaxase/mobilization nuclease domain-containing protein n=1 Tax=Sulfitobacter aestuariivivens TaxID=2766981 RepID=A0A927HFY5_9RHOB|nr:relaxase/mobilization nuclease domain-containing protein [Sulfitobacter aestuariivivens]MBD3664914.1 relaxase/mobilization nuclease domain-containing protein [Sulfitobacter aestuariivivens]